MLSRSKKCIPFLRLLLCCMTVLTGLTTAHYSFAQNNLGGGIIR